LKAEFEVFRPMKGQQLKATVVSQKPHEIICTYRGFEVRLFKHY
jgi:hypothetical protein